MVFLDFEKPLETLYEQLEKVREIGGEGGIDISKMENEILSKIQTTRSDIYSKLTGWQRVQLSRHPERPYSLYYIKHITDEFEELFGDRCFGDDKAIVGGLAKIDGKAVMLIGHQKGVNTKMRQYRNFGMANPEGYRKALRLMKMAEKFDIPVVCLIDTPGAYPGIEAEERGQAEAIARNLIEMAQLKVPIICVVIGEGASGGAIGIGLGDHISMLENTWYSVISPESCSSILWRSWDYKEQAAEELKLTPEHMLDFGLIDQIVAEPDGGAHHDPELMATELKKHIKKTIARFRKMKVENLIQRRIDKYTVMGRFEEKEVKKNKAKKNKATSS